MGGVGAVRVLVHWVGVAAGCAAYLRGGEREDRVVALQWGVPSIKGRNHVRCNGRSALRRSLEVVMGAVGVV